MYIVGLQPIYKYDLCPAQNLVYYLFIPQEVLVRCDFNFLGTNFEDFICMDLFFLICTFGLKLSRICNQFVFIKQGNFTFIQILNIQLILD